MSVRREDMYWQSHNSGYVGLSSPPLSDSTLSSPPFVPLRRVPSLDTLIGRQAASSPNVVRVGRANGWAEARVAPLQATKRASEAQPRYVERSKSIDRYTHRRLKYLRRLWVHYTNIQGRIQGRADWAHAQGPASKRPPTKWSFAPPPPPPPPSP